MANCPFFANSTTARSTMTTSRLGGLRSGPRSSAGGWSGSLLSRRHNQANGSQARSIPALGRQVASSLDEPVPLEWGLWRFGLARDQGPDLATKGCPARSREASRAAANASTAWRCRSRFPKIGKSDTPFGPMSAAAARSPAMPRTTAGSSGRRAFRSPATLTASAGRPRVSRSQKSCRSGSPPESRWRFGRARATRRDVRCRPSIAPGRGNWSPRTLCGREKGDAGGKRGRH